MTEVSGAASPGDVLALVNGAKLADGAASAIAALAGTGVTLATQDRQQRYLWLQNPPPAGPADWLGRTDAELFPAATAAWLAQAKQAVMRSGTACQCEVQIDWPSGVADYAVTLNALRGADGQVVGVATAAVDISQFKRTERQLLQAKQQLASVDASQRQQQDLRLRESEASYRAALVAGRLGTWQTDLVARTRHWTPEGMALFGLALADGLGQVGGEGDEYRQALHPEDRHLVQRLHALADQQDAFTSEYRVLLPDGSVRWLAGHGQVLARLADGRAHKLVSIVADITDRKQAELGLRVESERLALALKTGNMGIYDADLQSGLLWWSARTYALYGVDAQTFTPSLAAEAALVHAGDRHGFQVRRQEAIARGLPCDQEFRVLRADGRLVWIGHHGQTQCDADGRAVRHFGVAVDITQRKQAELALRAADRRKDEFIAVLAHELRNPLAPLRNALSLLRVPSASDSQRAWCLDVMDRQVTQMARLLDDLLDVSRLARQPLVLKRQALDIATAIAHAVELAQPVLDAHRHQLDLVLPPQALMVHADLTRLAQVLSNLLVNAAKYTPAGGRIVLRAVRQADDVLLSVSDNGIGIAAEHLQGIFEMFNQVHTEPDHAGMGLGSSLGMGLGVGLALARALVGLHGGEITVHSAGAGQGSEFSVRLPLLRPAAVDGKAQPGEPGAEQAATPGAAPSSAPRLTGRRRRVLVADDLRDAAESLAQLLTALGHEVHVAFDGHQALALAERERPDVALLDLGMPAVDGLEACRRIRAQPWGQHMVLIAQTGWGQPQDRRQTQAAGFDHHLVKPINLAALEALLAEPAPALPSAELQ